MENPLKKMWYNQTLKSEEFPKDMAEKFFINDSIDPLKHRENFALFCG